VERVFSVSHPDPVEVDKAKKALKVSSNIHMPYLIRKPLVLTNRLCFQEQEQSLIDAIARLAEASDGESGKY
jgi:hypothetical protein